MTLQCLARDRERWKQETLAFGVPSGNPKMSFGHPEQKKRVYVKYITICFLEQKSYYYKSLWFKTTPL